MNIARANTITLLLALTGSWTHAQQSTAAPTTRPALPEPRNWTAAQDHQAMMQQLGIKALRPGPSGNEQAPNHANYDEAKANPFPKFPDILALKNGRSVTTPRLWARRRAEIVEDFERERGDAKWLDQQGTFIAAVAAQPVFRLLGAQDLGVSDDYTKERMPPVNVGVLDGHLAWRQHDGGHTDGPNWKYFLSWADHFFGRRYTPAPPVPQAPQPTAAAQQGQRRADVPTPRTDPTSMLAHRQLLEKRTRGKIDLYFMGNSITRRWGATDYPDFLANWRANFHGWNAANFGWGADRIEHMLWRIENGELDGVNPKVIVILAGTNNVGQRPGGDEKVADITRGIRALIDLSRRKAPDATIILTGILPRNDNMAVVPEIRRINENIARFADGRSIRYLDINAKLADADGKLFEGMTVDELHLSLKGYQVWADALRPMLTELLGPPAATDQAPPPTGDPSARRP